MERLLTVEFGPSRSKRFGRALAEARSSAWECTEVEPGRYRARFLLGEDAAVYAPLARLLERVRHWRATEVSEGEEPVSSYHAKDIRIVDCPISGFAVDQGRTGIVRPRVAACGQARPARLEPDHPA